MSFQPKLSNPETLDLITERFYNPTASATTMGSFRTFTVTKQANGGQTLSRPLDMPGNRMRNYIFEDERRVRPAADKVIKKKGK